MTSGRDDDDRLDKLLAGGRLGGPARERVLGRVLGSVPDGAAQRRRRAMRIALAAAGAAAAMAAALVLIVRPHGAGEDAMRAKGAGAGAAVAASVTPLCASIDGTCQVGDRLMFRVDAAPERAFLLAYAEPLDGPAPGGDGRVWMFPTQSGESPEITPAAEPYFLRRAVEIDAAFHAGRYRVTMVLAKHALTRAQALRPGDGDGDGDAVRLTSTVVVK